MITIKVRVKSGRIEASADAPPNQLTSDCDIVHSIMEAIMKIGAETGKEGHLTTNYKP